MVCVVSRVVSSSLFDLRGKHHEIEMMGCSTTAGISEVLSNKNVNLTWTDRLNFGRASIIPDNMSGRKTNS